MRSLEISAFVEQLYKPREYFPLEITQQRYGSGVEVSTPELRAIVYRD